MSGELDVWLLPQAITVACGAKNPVEIVQAADDRLLEVWMRQRITNECRGCHGKSQRAADHSCAKATMTKEQCGTQLGELTNLLEPHRLERVMWDLLQIHELRKPQDGALACITRTIVYAILASFGVYKDGLMFAYKLEPGRGLVDGALQCVVSAT